MRRVPWRTIRGQLAQRRPQGRMEDAASFWSDFKARSPLYPRHAAAVKEPVLPAAVRWAVAGAAALALVAVVFRPWPSAGRAALSHVEQVKVIAPYGAVLIMDNARTQTTLVWIAGMDAEDQNGDLM